MPFRRPIRRWNTARRQFSCHLPRRHTGGFQFGTAILGATRSHTTPIAIGYPQSSSRRCRMRWREFITFLGGTVTMARWSAGVMILVIGMAGYQLGHHYGRQIELDSNGVKIDALNARVDATIAADKAEIDRLKRQ